MENSIRGWGFELNGECFGVAFVDKVIAINWIEWEMGETWETIQKGDVEMVPRLIAKAKEKTKPVTQMA